MAQEDTTTGTGPVDRDYHGDDLGDVYMGIRWDIVVWSGFVATTLATSFFWVTQSVKLTQFSPAVQIGCLFLDEPQKPATEAAGFLVLFIFGSTLVPAAYLLLVRHWDLPMLYGAAVLGAVHGALVVAILPMLGIVSACVRSGHLPKPGIAGVHWGWATPAVILAGHALYGAILGAVFTAFLTEGATSM